MNYDLDTEEGMANAKAWMVNTLAHLNEKGVWMVPRSGTIVTLDQKAKTAKVQSLLDDPSIALVLEAIGYTVTTTER